jgi:hypothetical protein
MESTPEYPTAEEASAALAGAEASRATLARGITTPAWFYTSLGVAIAAQIATAAAGLGGDAPWMLVAGLALFATVAGVQLGRFRRRNGVWLGGFAGRVVFGTGTSASVSYVMALPAAIWAASGARWWLVACLAIVGGAAYALSGRRWMGTYRTAPAAHGRGESARGLALCGVVGLAGLALLLINA